MQDRISEAVTALTQDQDTSVTQCMVRASVREDKLRTASGLSPVQTHGLYTKQLIAQLCIRRYLLNIGTVQ